MVEREREAKVAGALAGALVGNALGAPLLWLYPSQVRIKHARVKEMLGGGQLLLRPGELTEKAGLLLVLAELLATGAPYRLEESVAAALGWLAGWGREVEDGVRQARELLGQGVAPGELAARLQGAALQPGGSPLTRSLALGLRHPPGEAEAILAGVRQECGWSQPDGETAAAAGTLALLLSLLLEGEPLQPATVGRAERLLAAAGGFRPVLADPSCWRPHPDQPTPAEPAGLASTVVAVLCRGQGFFSALQDVVELGGPADASGCLAGALAGAAHGAQALPAAWWRPVREASRARDAGIRLAACRWGGT